jgi:ketosteroid isomerase-like protein
MRSLLSVLLATLVLTVSLSSQEMSRAQRELVEAERAFAKYSVENGIAESWVEKEVIAFFDVLTDAGLKRDVATLDRLYSDDYFHTNPDGSIMTKAQVLASYKAPLGAATIDSDEHDEDRVIIRGNVAVLNTRVTIKGRFNSEPYTRMYRITYVFEKKKGAWRAVMSHATLILQSAK